MACGRCQTCDSCRSCQRCDDGNRCSTCQTCVACQYCDACQLCNSECQVTCNTAQTYDGRTIASFFGCFNAFNPNPVADRTQMGTGAGMFNKASWDALITYINQRHNLPVSNAEGVKENNSDGGDIISYSSDDPTSERSVSPFKASEFNRLYKIVYKTSRNLVSQNQLIEASFFTNLATKANSMTVDNGACEMCITKCDSGCDACQLCIECQTCDKDNHDCDYCYSGCYGCNTCNRNDDCGSCDICNVKCNSGESSSCTSGAQTQ